VRYASLHIALEEKGGILDGAENAFFLLCLFVRITSTPALILLCEQRAEPL